MNPQPTYTFKPWHVLLLCMFTILVVALLMKNKDSALDKVQMQNELRVITRNSATTYYESSDSYAGFEYDLAKAFADHLGVNLKILTVEKLSDVIPKLNGGQADLAAAGTSPTAGMLATTKAGPGYQSISSHLIYKSQRGIRNIKRLSQLPGKRIIISGNESHHELLEELKTELKETYPDAQELSWIEDTNLDNDELLKLIDDGHYDLTVMNSNEFDHYRRLFPSLNISMTIGDKKPLQWLFSGKKDTSLQEEAELFFKGYKKNGELNKLIERYYSHISQYSAVEMTVFLKHVNSRLSLFKSTFQDAAELYGVDWRLLAAIAYQESHWRTDATSPTGVRGIMMLTNRTARELNVTNRLDSRESIMGGAQYFLKMKGKMSEKITEPDRSWMALASYNVGYGHLEDARKLTQKTGGDPNHWIDVKERLPLLSQQEWHSQTRHGYARGREPVVYVKNIRRYYQTLKWLDDRISTEETSDIDDKDKNADLVIPQIL